MLRILVLSKRQYMNKDLIDDRFGRFREIPLALANKGHSLQGLCLSYHHKTAGLFYDGPVCWQSINSTRLMLPGLFVFIIKALKYTKRSDVIWACSDSFYGIIGCIIGRLYNVPVIFDIYDNFDEFFVAKLPIVRQLYHWAIRQSDAITCLSSSFANYLFKQYNRKQYVYPVEFAVRDDLFKPVDKQHCRRKLGLPPDALIIGTAGGLFINREVHLLLDAYGQLRENHPTLELALAGPLDPGLPIPDNARIHYLGVLPFETVPYFMNALDVAVVCYADDEFGKYCFPQKTREFMACDVPVIAANVGSLRELFKEHPEWLYEPGNTESLAKTLENRMFNRQTDYKIPPTWPELADRLEGIIEKLANENK